MNIDKDMILKYGVHETMVADVSDKGLAYLLQYGFAQSLQDSVAGYAKKLRDEGKEDGTAYSDDEIKSLTADRMAARFDDIIAGDVGTRVGAPRLSGVDKIMRDVARENLKAAAIKADVKLPTGEAMTKLIEQYIAKHGDKTRAEAERRMASVATDDTDVLGDLIAAQA